MLSRDTEAGSAIVKTDKPAQNQKETVTRKLLLPVVIVNNCRLLSQ